MKTFAICCVLFITFIAVGVLAAAGNKVQIQQILGPGTSTTGSLFGWLANGTPAFLKVGTNLSIDSSGNLNAASATIPAGAFQDNLQLGVANGTTTAFNLPNSIVANPTTSVYVWVNGVKAQPTNDYTVAVSGTTTTITFTTAPPSGANIEASCRTAGF